MAFDVYLEGCAMAAFRTRTLFRIALGVFAFSLASRMVYYTLTEGFCLKRIEAPLPYEDNLSTRPPSAETLRELSSITKQPFRYMKKGSQAYAFLSDDGKYVLKLFKLHHMQPAEWMKELPCPSFLQPYRDNLVHRRRNRIDLTLSSYVIAANHLPLECALVYAQVLSSKDFSLPITIVDAIGRTYTIDLAHYGFAIQYRANLVTHALSEWIQSGRIDTAKTAIDSLVALIVQRSAKGIQDSDPDLHKNAGLIGTSAVHIDIGSFFANPNISSLGEMKFDMKKIFSNLLKWLKTTSPELHDHLLVSLERSDCLLWEPPATP